MLPTRGLLVSLTKPLLVSIEDIRRPVQREKFGVGPPPALTLTPDASCVHHVSGEVLQGAKVFRDFVSRSEAAFLSDEVQGFAASKHAVRWGGYRSANKKPLRHFLNFYGKSTHQGTTRVSLLENDKEYIDSVAVMHAPRCLRQCAQIYEAGVFAEPPNSFRMNEYEAEGGTLLHNDPKWQGNAFAVLSLESPAVLRFSRLGGHEALVLLPERSLACFDGAAVTSWRHEIPCETSTFFPPLEKNITKDYRTSVVFYTMREDLIEVNDN